MDKVRVFVYACGIESCPPETLIFLTIASVWFEVPRVCDIALAGKVEAWSIPMGSVSRMIRAQATHSPGHITTVGLGTYLDPLISGGAANEQAKNSELHKELIRRLQIDGEDYLMYKALPIDVGIIRGTTADPQGSAYVKRYLKRRVL